MPGLAWQSFQKANAESEYLVLLTFLPLKSVFRLPKFISYTLRIQQQLAGAKGLVGYALLARLFKLQFFTLSAWESDKALSQFVREIPHSGAMTAFQGDFNSPLFIRWKLNGSDLPPSWEDALRQLEGEQKWK